MAHSFAEREVSRNAEFRTNELRWMTGLRQPADMTGKLHIHLRAHRKSRGLRQSNVAEAIGVAFNTLSGWENGARTMDLKDLEKLAEFYGVHPAALLLAPEEGPKFEVMRKASGLAEQMGPEAAADWIRMGERIAPSKPDE